MKKVSFAITVLILLIVLVSFVSAELTASISMPRMVLYKNISDGGNLAFENFVGVNNNNNHSVSILIVPIGAWKGRVNISEIEFIMQPGEKRDVYYTLYIEKAGYYSGEIDVIFSENNSKNTLSLPQKLVVIVQDENGKVPEEITTPYIQGSEKWNKRYTLLAISGFLVALVLLLIITKLAMRKK